MVILATDCGYEAWKITLKYPLNQPTKYVVGEILVLVIKKIEKKKYTLLRDSLEHKDSLGLSQEFVQFQQNS